MARFLLQDHRGADDLLLAAPLGVVKEQKQKPYFYVFYLLTNANTMYSLGEASLRCAPLIRRCPQKGWLSGTFPKRLRHQL